MQTLEQYMDAHPKEGVRVRGFYRVHIVEDDDTNGFAIVGDSGWQENQITNIGVLNIVNQLGTSLTGSKLSHLGLGTGGVPASDATALTGEVEARAALTAATSGSTALQMTATFASSASFVTNTQNLSCIGVYASATGSSLIAGSSFASSSCATNQAVNATYTLTFTR